MINYITAPFKWFFKLEAASGLLLLISAIIALIVSNTNLSDNYFNILKSNERKSFHDKICKELFKDLGWNFTTTF